MISINLHQPGQLNCYLQLPSAWNELETPELLEVCRQQLLPNNTQPKAKAALLKFVLQYRAKQQKARLPKDWVARLDAEQAVVGGFPLFDFLYAGNDLTRIPEQKICVWRSGLPYNLYAQGETKRAEAFETLTCGEYEDADTFFREFFDNPAPEPLANLAAIIYRPKGRHYLTVKPDGQPEPYNASAFVTSFSRVNASRLFAIFTWWGGCKALLPKLFPTVHENNGGAPDPLAFTRCIHAGAGPKNGSRTQIRTTNLYEFMFDMEEEAIKAKEMKAEYDRLKAST